MFKISPSQIPLEDSKEIEILYTHNNSTRGKTVDSRRAQQMPGSWKVKTTEW
jgi:hypothetical protein